MTRRHPHRRATLCLAACALIGAGCATTDRQPAEPAPAETGPLTDRPLDLEEEYLIGPALSRRLGHRIDWQVRLYPQEGSGIRRVALQADSVFVLDGRNFLTRLNEESGRQLWRIPVADPHTEIFGITYLPYFERIFLTSGGGVYVLDAQTGSQVDRQKLEQIANTAPAVAGRVFIYGARNGQLVWHSYEVGYSARRYQVAPSIRIAPLLVGDTVVAIGTDGTITALDASDVTGRWQLNLLDAIVAEPVASADTLYVAGLDQYLWAIDMTTGRRIWRYLSEAPLVDSPTLVGDRVYQQVPGHGLMCFEADPQDAPGGNLLWGPLEVDGNVVGAYGAAVLVWDERGRRISMIDSGVGALRDGADTPLVRHLVVDGLENGPIFAAADDGRVTRLVPR